MPEITVMFFLVAVLAITFAGVSKAGFGSGAAFASSSILALIVQPGAALAFMLPLLMLIDAVSLRPYWRRWRLRESLLLILGGLPGVALGAAFYKSVDADAMRVLIGAISVAFVAWQLSGRLRVRLVKPRERADVTGVVAGVVAGFTSFVSHAGGPPAAVYLLGRSMSKTEYQASTVLVFGILNAAKFVPYAMLGMVTPASLTLDLMLAPFALLGAWIGVRLHHRVSEPVFFGLTYVLLVTTGTKLIWDGLT
ncbi:sulfite exporter TauE/SafE family protein [Phaeobacter sp. HS012]|uniref:sulfite exporter TauE/SafE family protein n=1 Tax=unclassified Phaeobacter TaxID=2621772 RepID=UPI001B37649D|nr:MULTISPECIES: sulfite exporter TauE/SafE family protein [unclassified Phaeobacter]MBQ4808405.1 sulfite exporter TauE/SafE family protein [Phaeobacter sp. HS012]MBQ4883377.1 sulfite exporter TauE/SafE family protein [Phaeobacter sp. HS011]